LVLQETYIKSSIDNIEVEIGRDSMWWGPGRHGSLLLSNNPPPFNMLKISNMRPFRLKGPAGRLGIWDVTAFIARLEDERDFPGARLFGLRVGISPSSSIEINLTRTLIFGGKGRPSLDPLDYLKVFFAVGENKPGKLDNDQLAGGDFRITLTPPLSMAGGAMLYGQIIGEDEAGGLPSNYGVLGGALVTDLLNTGWMDIRLEYANDHLVADDALWYGHGLYTSGYTYHHRLIGYPMGGFEDDFFKNGVFRGSAAWDFFIESVLHGWDDTEITLSYDLERHRRTEPVKETKEEARVEISRRISDRVELNIGEEYEKITNWKGMSGLTKDNNYLTTRIDVEF